MKAPASVGVFVYANPMSERSEELRKVIDDAIEQQMVLINRMKGIEERGGFVEAEFDTLYQLLKDAHSNVANLEWNSNYLESNVENDKPHCRDCEMNPS